MSKFRTGIQEIQKQAAGSGGKKNRWTPNIYWKAGDSKTLAWLTDATEIPKVALHPFVRVPDDSREQGFRYETFLCRKDESMIDESGGYCELCDRVGHEPVIKFVAMAVELEAIKEGKRTTGLKIAYDTRKNKEGVEVDYPRWGMVTQASKNFFSYLAAYHENTGDIREVGWEIVREGGSTDTKYHHFELKAPLPDLSELEVPDVTEVLENMGSDEKYAMVADIGANSQPEFDNGSKPVDAGTVPSGSRDSEFAKIREELSGKVESY